MRVWRGSWASEPGRRWPGAWSPGVRASGAPGALRPRSRAGAREAALRLEPVGRAWTPQTPQRPRVAHGDGSREGSRAWPVGRVTGSRGGGGQRTPLTSPGRLGRQPRCSARSCGTCLVPVALALLRWREHGARRLPAPPAAWRARCTAPCRLALDAAGAVPADGLWPLPLAI